MRGFHEQKLCSAFQRCLKPSFPTNFESKAIGNPSVPIATPVRWHSYSSSVHKATGHQERRVQRTEVATILCELFWYGNCCM